jgi:hypothetical protein
MNPDSCKRILELFFLILSQISAAILALSGVQHFLENGFCPFFPHQRSRPEQIHVFLGLDMRDDSEGGKSIHVNLVPEVVIVVKVCVQHEADRSVGPLPDLGNVFTRGRGQKAGVYDEDLPVADDHRGVAATIAGVLNFIHTVGQLRHFSLVLPPQRGGSGKSDPNDSQ